ncbi:MULTISPECIES: hypothetical protein [Mesorhizobium]|nr:MULTISPECIES: hypothetical protein [Mesorhizobium]
MVFIAIVGSLIFGVANMGYNQAKANPDAEHFLDSKSNAHA